MAYNSRLLFIIKGSQDRNLKQDSKLQGRKPEAGADAEAMEGVLLMGLLLMACSACFVIELRTTCSGVVPLIMG